MFKKLLQISIILAFIVVVLGAYTRLADSGLACPDWPGCYGQLTVPELPLGTIIDGYQRPLNPEKGIKEMVHRYAAAVLGLLILALFFLALKGKTNRHQSVVLPSFLLLMVMLQGALGMWSVTQLVHPGIVSIHLAGGFITTSLLVWLLFNQSSSRTYNQSILTKHKYLSIIAIILLGGQIMLGGWTSANYAAFACGAQFPQCLNQWLPLMDFNSAFSWGEMGIDYEYGVLDNNARVAIQMTHRIGAFILILALSGLIFVLRQYQHLRPILMIIGVVLIGQIVLGILNVVWSLPITIAIAHNALALILLLSLLRLIHKICFKPKQV